MCACARYVREWVYHYNVTLLRCLQDLAPRQTSRRALSRTPFPRDRFRTAADLVPPPPPAIKLISEYRSYPSAGSLSVRSRSPPRTHVPPPPTQDFSVLSVEIVLYRDVSFIHTVHTDKISLCVRNTLIYKLRTHRSRYYYYYLLTSYLRS